MTVERINLQVWLRPKVAVATKRFGQSSFLRRVEKYSFDEHVEELVQSPF